MTTLLQVKNLRTQFKVRRNIVHAVNGVSYTLNTGETLAIVGESGSGKSVGVMSLLRLIPMPPGQIIDGEVMFEGRDLLRLNKKEIRAVRGKEISVIFQDPMTSLNPVMSIGRQISEALQLHLKLNKEAARERTIELLKLVGIPSAAERYENYPHQFSGGMRQRVMIAMGLSCNPKLLIADEPTTALDVTIQAQIVQLVKKLRRQLGMSVIWISHDLGVVASLADRVAVMYAGFIVEKAPAKEVFAAPRHPYTLGLLDSLPKLNEPAGHRLKSINGLPPNLLHLPPGCPFYRRCTYRIARCKNENPVLEQISPKHTVACWVNGREQQG